MKVLVNRPVELDINTIHVEAHVRYPEDSAVYDGKVWLDDYDASPIMPCMEYKRDGWYWCPIIDIATGRILNWKLGMAAQISYKVVDEFSCKVKDGEAIVTAYEGYVPDFMAPAEEGWGDYIYMDVNTEGYIEDWKFGEKDFVRLDNGEY